MDLSASNATNCLNDDSFGPVVVGCRADFDFTVTFEQSILSIGPSAAFAILASLRIAQLSRKPTILRARQFQLLKLGTIAVYAALELALLVFAAKAPTGPRSTTIASAALGLLDALLFLALSALEHSRSWRTSILFNSYLLLTLLFDIAQSRTLWLQHLHPTVAKLFTASLGLKVAILLLEAQGKHRWIQRSKFSPEQLSGIFSLGLFSWLNSLIIGGYRKILSTNDLYVLDERLSAEALEKPFWGNWLKSAGHKRRLIRSLLVTLKWPILAPVIPRIAYGAFGFGQPFLIQAILSYLQIDRDERSKNDGYGLIGAGALIFSGIAVTNGLYWYTYKRSISMLRSCLVTAIYRTATTLPSYGQDNSAVLTLMNTDVMFIQQGFQFLHECWANMIECAIACWLLEGQLGKAFVWPLVVVIICGATAILMGKRRGKSMGALMKRTQKRVGLTTNSIANMIPLKMSGLAMPIETLVQEYRQEEIKAQAQMRLLTTFATVVAFIPLLISPVATFGATGKELTFTRVFTSLAYIQLLCNPLTMLFQTIPAIVAAMACLGRIEKFLEKHDSSRAASENEADPGSEGNSTQQTPGSIISISNGTFGWEAGKPVIEKVDLAVPTSKLTIVVGPVASGKTTLCKGLLGEVPFMEGLTNIPRGTRISYCDQSPFLINESVRNNVVGFGTPDDVWYNEVIQATGLAEDLAAFPDGDNSLIGTNGITLSGGQRQRVAVARAVFSRPRIAIFDDVFSGLDSKTEEHVFDRIFGADGLLRRIGASVILCTHSTRHLPAADHIVAIGNQTILEQGTFRQLMSHDGYVKSLGADEKRNKSREQSKEDSSVSLSRPKRDPEEAREDKSRQLGDLAVYKFYFSHFDIGITVFFLISALAFAFTYNFNAVWLEFWSASVHKGENRYSFYLGIYVLLQVSCVLLIIAFFGSGGMVMLPRAALIIHHRALKTLMRAPISYFTSVDIGVTTNHFSQDISVIDNDLSNALWNTLSTVLVCTGQAAVIGASSPYVIIGYPGLIALLYIIQRIYLRTSRQLRHLELEAKAPLYTHFIETLNGLMTIRAFSWVGQNIELNNRLFNESQRAEYLFEMIQQWLNTVLGLTVAVIAVVFITFATQLNISSPGLTGVGLISVMEFGRMLAALVRIFTLLETATGALARLKRFIERIPNEGSDDVPGGDVPGIWPSRGDIELQWISARYEKFDATSTSPVAEGRGTDSSSPNSLALRNITLSVKSGEKIVICGRTGSGKSSLVLLLERFLNPTSESGHITIDGLQLSEVPHATIRERIITLPQSPFLLTEGHTIRDNLELNATGVSTTAHDEDAVYALQAVGLWELVQERGGTDAELKADSLSKGQKQLFCLARAVLKKRLRERSSATSNTFATTPYPSPPTQNGGILILDEFNSGVDDETDRLMQSIVRREFDGYTVLCVAHRLRAVLDYDSVLVMSKGEIVETGRPQELLKDMRSKFRELWVLGGVAGTPGTSEEADQLDSDHAILPVS